MVKLANKSVHDVLLFIFNIKFQKNDDLFILIPTKVVDFFICL